MNTFGNNGELPVDPVDPVDPIDLRLEDQFLVQYFQESLWQEEDEQWLQDVLCNNSAAAVAQGDIVQGDYYHRASAANISAMQTRSEPVGGSTSAPKKIEIKVELWERLATRKSRYTLHVGPTDKVSDLRTLLVNRKAKLPERYIFSYCMAVLNEDKSFLDQGMVGVEVPKLELLDNVTNFSQH